MPTTRKRVTKTVETWTEEDDEVEEIDEDEEEDDGDESDGNPE